MLQTSPASASWQSYVKQQTKDTFYCSEAWLNLITRLYGYAFRPITATDAEGQVTGFLPLFQVQSPLTGKRLVALPFSDYCPLLSEDKASTNTLVDQAIEMARRQRARYLELRVGANEVLANRSDLVAIEDLYVRWLLPLSSDADAVWSGLRKPVQHQIKKSRKMGVEVRIAERREDMEHYYRLHLQTRSKKHGMPAQPRRFFYELWDRFAAQETMRLLLAYYQEQVIAGMVIFGSGDTVRYAYGASDEQQLQLAPNNLLMWTAITWGCEHGYKTLDMGRTACNNEGLMEFKRRWGATKEPLTYYYYPEQAGLASTSESSWKYRMLTSTWKKLPLPLAGSLGSLLYKHMG